MCRYDRMQIAKAPRAETAAAAAELALRKLACLQSAVVTTVATGGEDKHQASYRDSWAASRPKQQQQQQQWRACLASE